MDVVHSTRSPIDCKSILPRRAFAALPHDVEGDPRLSPTDKALLLALTYWARAKDHCWPSDETIGRRIGRSAATVQRRLRFLESVGLVEREKTATNRTGRLIRLLWKAGSLAAHEGPPQSSVTEAPRSPVRDKGRRSVEPEALKGIPEPREQGGTQRRPEPEKALVPTPEPAHAPPPNSSASALSSTAIEQAHAWLASGDPILRAEAERRLRPKPAPRPEPATLAETLSRIHESPNRVPIAAELLSQEFNDRKSWSGFHAVCRRAFEGDLPPAVLVDALDRANRPGVRNRGALFMSVTRCNQ